MENDKNTLTEIFDRYRTDKGSVGHGAEIHNYGLAYEQFFEEFRGKGISICELGVLDGNSLRSWRDYFENAKVLGVDNNSLTLISEPGLKTIFGDQSDPIELKSIIAGEWDIIIDDGSHEAKHQQECLYHLIGLVKSGGYYVIEDLHTYRMNHPKRWLMEQFDDRTAYTFDFVRNGFDKSKYLTTEQVSELVSKIESVNVYQDKLAIIKVK